MRLPQLVPDKGDKTAPTTDGVLLAVYAPFGADEVLSKYPDGTSQELAQHPLFQALLKVAAQRAHVVALIDLAGDDTYLVEIEAGRPQDVKVTSRWKQAMSEPRNLAGFLLHAHNRHPAAAMVLALEGHGAGFLPDLDPRQMTAANVTEGGRFEWKITGGTSVPQFGGGAPVLPMGAPTLPMGAPTLPGNMPLSTWGLGAALKMAIQAGVPRLPVIHFDNCFNLSVELMHTIAPHARYATAYANYNFFSAGEYYPRVFEQLRAAGGANAEQIACWFADANRDFLAAKKNHPTMGGVVRLDRMKKISELIDDLADALLAALRGAGALRPQVVDAIKKAIKDAQQYDSLEPQVLDAPDELTDIRSLAHHLQKQPELAKTKVPSTAADLEKAMAGIQRYGETDQPWTAPGTTWDFDPKKHALAMNIFLPDPLLWGIWDWRSPYYLSVNPDPSRPRVQPNIIDFVKVTDWVDFLIEYHKDVKFVGLLAPRIPTFPVYNASYEPKKPDEEEDDDCGDDEQQPGGPGKPDGTPGQTGGDKPSGGKTSS